jgi:DNA repair protein RecO (recombination protein O)
MIESATGLILRTRLLTETSLIVNWLTPELGRVATVAKGARRPKSAFACKLDLFYRCDFSFVRSRRSELHTLREVVLRDTHAALRQDLLALHQAAYAVALLELATETETPLPVLYELLAGWLAHLASAPVRTHLLLGFELKLLEELGLTPDLRPARLSPGAREIAAQLLAQDWPTLGRLHLSPSQATELRHFLEACLLAHLGRIPRGRAAALAGEL